MHPFRRVLLNAGALLAAYVLPRSLTVAAALIAARMLQPAAFGGYGVAAALAFSLSIIATLGMLPLLVREIARAPQNANELVAAAHRIKAALFIPMLAAILIVARLLDLPADVVAAAILLGTGHCAWAIAENYGARLQAEERLRPWLAANLVFGVVSGGLAALAVVMTHSVVWFCAGFAAGQLAALLFLIVNQRARDRNASAAAWRPSLWPLARAAAPFALAFFALTVFYKADVLLLSRLRGSYDAGIYAAAYKLVDIIHALAVITAAAVYPRLARLAGTLATRRMLELFLLTAAAGTGCMWLLRVPIITLLYGAAYADSVQVLAWLAPAAGVLTLNIFAGYILALTDRIKLLAVAYAAGCIVKFGLGFALMRDGGAAGAATAALMAESALACALLVALASVPVALPRRRPVTLSALTVAGACACGAAFTPALGALVFVTGVVVLYVAAGALTADERTAMRAAIKPVRVTAGAA